MWCVVGLGNPGRQYQETRHNLGFMVVDLLAKQDGAAWSRRALYHCARPGGQDELLLFKPTTFMNLSGAAVSRIVRYHAVARHRLLVVCDDVDLPFGRLRLRASGSAGGHRGLESIIQSLGSEEFARLRMGIGRPDRPGGTPEHVLGGFHPAERKALAPFIDRAAAAVRSVAELGIDKAMNEINRTKKEEPR